MSLEALFLFAHRLDDGHCPTKWPVPLQLQQRPVMNFTHIRNKVKMLLKEQKMLILQFVVLIFVTIFTVLRIKKLVFFYTLYNIYKVWVLLSCFSVVF